MMDINLECFVMDLPLKHIPRFRRFSLPSRPTVWPDEQKDKNVVVSGPKHKHKQELNHTSKNDGTFTNFEESGNLEQRNRSHSEYQRDISLFNWGKHNKNKRSLSVNEEEISQVLNDEIQHEGRLLRRKSISARKRKNSKDKKEMSPIRDEFLHEISTWFKKINAKDSEGIFSHAEDNILVEELEESPIVSEVKLSLIDKPLTNKIKLEGNKGENEPSYTSISQIQEEHSDDSSKDTKPVEIITEEDTLDGVHKNHHKKKYEGISPTEHRENYLWHRVHNSQSPDQKESLWHRRQNVLHSIRKRLTSFSSEVSDSSRDSNG